MWPANNLSVTQNWQCTWELVLYYFSLMFKSLFKDVLKIQPYLSFFQHGRSHKVPKTAVLPGNMMIKHRSVDALQFWDTPRYHRIDYCTVAVKCLNCFHLWSRGRGNQLAMRKKRKQPRQRKRRSDGWTRETHALQRGENTRCCGFWVGLQRSQDLGLGWDMYFTL